MKKLLGLVILAPALVLAWTANVLAGETICPPNLGVVTVGNVEVPAGLFCFLRGTTVTGNVLVEGALVARADFLTGTPTTIKGNVKGDPADLMLVIEGTVVEGNVQVKLTAAPPFLGSTNRICGATIRGDLQFEENARRINIGASACSGLGGANTVDGDVLVELNTGGATITGNTIGGDLVCIDNVPAAISVSNTVGGVDDC